MQKHRRIYIAGPMSNLDDDELDANIMLASQIEGHLLIDGWDVYNPFASCVCRDNFEIDPELWYQMDLRWLADCDAIILLPGWEGHDGCIREHDYCRDNDKDVLFA